MKKTINRRSFLKIGAVTGIVSGLPASNTTSAATRDLSGVQSYVTLGRTGLSISDISFGSSRLRERQENLVQHAFHQGVNYFDTAESYTNGTSETVIGRALKGKRDKVLIATKTAASTHHDRDRMMRALEQSLKRLQTEYVDIYFNHAVNDVDRLKNPEWLEFAEMAKRQGKIRFTGMSGHAGRLADCLDYAMDNDMFDALLVAYNFGEDPSFYDSLTRNFDFVANQVDLPRVLKKAKANNVGVVTMKVLRGARLNDMRPFETGGATFAQAAFRWVLNSPLVDAAIISMTSYDNINEYLGASGGMQVTQEDTELLEQYARLTDVNYCRPACDDCESACPYNVPISDVLRTRMYAVDYQDLDFAKREYAQLGAAATACLSCDGTPCQNACTYGLNISKLCRPTHQMLS